MKTSVIDVNTSRDWPNGLIIIAHSPRWLNGLFIIIIIIIIQNIDEAKRGPYTSDTQTTHLLWFPLVLTDSRWLSITYCVRSLLLSIITVAFDCFQSSLLRSLLHSTITFAFEHLPYFHSPFGAFLLLVFG